MANVGLGIIFWILTFISVAGGCVTLGLIPLYYWLQHTPREKQRLRWHQRVRIALITALLLPSGLCGWISYIENSYWDYQGWDEFWRAPLVYPYEIRTETIAPEAFCVGRWHEKECVINKVAGYSLHDDLMLGVINGEALWFVLNTKTGTVDYYSEFSRLQEDLVEKGIEPPTQFESSAKLVRAYWERAEP